LAEVNATLDDLIGRFDGVQPLEQGEGDSCVTTFKRARGAVACSLALQQALIRAPLKLPVGVHTGDVQRRDDRNHAGATVTRTARVRNLGGGGKNLLSQAT
jgi:class 3 adenylate cyclase